MATEPIRDSLDTLINQIPEDLLLEELRDLNDRLQSGQELQQDIVKIVDKTRAYADVPVSDLETANEKLKSIQELLAAAVNLERYSKLRKA